MAKYKGNFRCLILSPKNTLFESEISSLFICGNKSEYEILPYHYPIVGLVRQGNIIIDWKKKIPVRSGIVRFFANECTVLVEETDRTFAAAQKGVEAAKTSTHH